MGSLITKHKYFNTCDYRITVNDTTDMNEITRTLETTDIENLRNIIQNKVLIFSVQKSKINEFEYFTSNNSPFNEQQLYCLDLKKKDKEYYCYQFSLNKIPVIQDNNIAVGCNAVISFHFKSNFYLIFVKDKTKSFFTNLGGGSEHNEDSDRCICREIEEEIGLTIEEDALFHQFAQSNKKIKIPVIGTSIRTCTYSYNILISESNAIRWLKNTKLIRFFKPDLPCNIIKIKNEEIEKIAIVKVTTDVLTSDKLQIGNIYATECSLDLVSYVYNKFYLIDDTKMNRTTILNKMVFL